MKDLIERLRSVLCCPEVTVCIQGSQTDRHEVQDCLDALERLTQPVGLEPVADIFNRDGVKSARTFAGAAALPYGTALYSAETVARLQAERDEAQLVAIAQAVELGTAKVKCDALQEQVKLLRDAALPYINPYHGDEQPKTFACHHSSETCLNCEQLVKRWKEQNVLLEALAATEPKETRHD